ncbi:hypothetical protein [uncultured Methanobrevibacter sp.]|uniref:hypothetical protein n=1 Tax=uncultured Methanobrevibacter sp. TaxID=253161 RepID=UPI00260F13E1
MGSSKTLDEYLDKVPERKEQDPKLICKVCGKKLEKENIFNRCKNCTNKLALVDDIHEILEYVAPGESFREMDLINRGFKSLKLHMLISKFLQENLILLRLDGLFTLNEFSYLDKFIRKYGDSNSYLDKNLYEDGFGVNFNDDESKIDEIDEEDNSFIDISDYSSYIKVRFNPRTDKWVVDFYNNKKLLHSKSFVDSVEANEEAIHYLKEIGKLGTIIKKEKKKSSNKRQYSSHEGIYYSPSRKMWGAKVQGYKGFKFIGHFNTEQEAYEAREKYLEEKEKTRQDFIREKIGIKARKQSGASGEGIYFSKQSGKWIVRLKNSSGHFENVGRFSSEEEAIKAKEDFLKTQEED